MSFYNFSVTDINGNKKNLADYKGRPSLIVNVASKCGFTPQYKDLQRLYDEYEGKILILGFPCNQFGKQEAGTNEEIIEFCSKTYNVNFPMFDKIEVKGPNAAPAYQYLNRQMSDEPKWNFHKYLVDKNGIVIASYPSKVKPFDDELIINLKKLI